MLKKAVIYCRTACKKFENDNLALGQEKVCLDFAEEKGIYEILGISVDEGMSDINEKQSRLRKLFQILKKKRAEALITYDVTRISRNHRIYEDFRKLLQTEGVELVTVTPDLYEIGDHAIKDYEKYKEKVRRLKRRRITKPGK